MAATDLDMVSIEGLDIDTVIGVYEWEKKQTQQLRVDVDMAWDNKPAADSDGIADALDYAAVSDAVLEWVKKEPRQLIETVAEGIAELVLTQFRVPWVKVKVSKPGAVPAAANVAVSITRTAAPR